MTIKEAEELDVLKYLINPDQIAQWNLVKARTVELVHRELKGRVVIEVQGGRINCVFDQPQIAGTSQALFYLEKIKID